MCPDFVIFQDDIPSKKAASNGLTSKFEVRVTRTITESFLVEAEDWEEAEDIVQQGDIKPYRTKEGEDFYDTDEVDDDGAPK